MGKAVNKAKQINLPPLPQEASDQEKHLHKLFDSDFKAFLQQCVRQRKHFDTDLTIRAYNRAINAHRDILRKSGDPYFQHLFDVARILAELNMDSTTIASGLLHDTIEDTSYSYDDIAKEFGQTVAELVDGVTKISGIRFDNREIQQGENFRKMLLSMTNDIRVVIIKLADRLNNMRTLEYMPLRKRQQIATETIEVYAPLAHRLGMAKIRVELEDLCLKYLDNKAYMQLVQQVNSKKDDREQLLKKIREPISERLKANGLNAQVEGRAKHFYSIYQKMQRQQKSFAEIYDLLAIRIIVEKKEECYAALGLVHSMYTPLADRFKDYIATPKNNGYRSLHTTVVALDQLLEIQIRTVEMHREAEEGIAAHWHYKEGDNQAENDPYIHWVRRILQQRNEDSSPEDFMDNFKADLYQEEVFAYSPKGQLFKLPQGASVLDFAFEIHSNLGLKTIGAKVNGHIVPLKYNVSNGEVIEIITTKNPIVNRDWLDIVKTSKARHAIRKWLKEKEVRDSAELGRQMLENALKENSLTLSNDELKAFAKSQGYHDLQALYAAIGHDDISTKTIIKKLKPEESGDFLSQTGQMLQSFVSKARKDVALQVEGIESIMITFAKCCQPVPGDTIIGYVTRGRGVTIHRHDCNNIMALISNSPKEKIVKASWGMRKKSNFPIQLYVEAEDRGQLLQDITNAIGRVKDTSILMVNLRAHDGLASGIIMVDVNDLDHLTRIIGSMQKIKNIIKVERFEGQRN
jgi:guanosine-3',5'-bis(diphosphate) 3'-pyrophosphohydrolase